MKQGESPINRKTIESLVRLGLLVLLMGWCYRIVSPFIPIVIWALIIAVAVYPPYRWLAGKLGNRQMLAGSVFAILGLAAVIIPAVLFTDTMVKGTAALSTGLKTGEIQLPPPPAGIIDWPIVGHVIDSNWRLASENMGELVHNFEPQLKSLGSWLVGMAAKSGLGILEFMLSVVIAGVFLAHSRAGVGYVNRVVYGLAEQRGLDYLGLVIDTIRSVAKGVVGVALLQSMLAGLGFLAAGLPGAGLLTLLCLLFCVTQIGPWIVLIPSTVYVFYTGDHTTAVIFLVWNLLVMTIDNVLKPILLGRGVDVPMLVIFIGAVGGLLASGFIGLFVGAIVLVLGYSILQAWLNELPEAGE